MKQEIYEEIGTGGGGEKVQTKKSPWEGVWNFLEPHNVTKQNRIYKQFSCDMLTQLYEWSCVLLLSFMLAHLSGNRNLLQQVQKVMSLCCDL